MFSHTSNVRTQYGHAWVHKAYSTIQKLSMEDIRSTRIDEEDEAEYISIKN